MQTWIIYALLSAFCAAFVSIFGKVGLQNIDSTNATMIRAVIMALFLIGAAVIHGQYSDIAVILENKKALIFITLSGLAGASSWLFYFMALKTGPVSQVAPIDKLSVVFAVIMAILFFGEKVTLIQGIAITLIAIGGLMLAIF